MINKIKFYRVFINYLDFISKITNDKVQIKNNLRLKLFMRFNRNSMRRVRRVAKTQPDMS